MITKEELKKEVDKLPDGFVEEVYALLNRFVKQKKMTEKVSREKWQQCFNMFTPDFMEDHAQPPKQTRVFFD